MKRIIAAVVLAGALAVPAGADAAVKTYGGKINKGGRIGIDVNLAGGVPMQIMEMRFKKFPANCSVSGPSVLKGAVAFTDFFVNPNNYRFAFDGDVDGMGSHLLFNGKFNDSAKKVNGEVDVKAVFGPDPGPAQTCNTKTRNYSAERGAKAPKAKIAPAFRIG